MTSHTDITDAQITALRAEASAHGDHSMVEACDRALAGDTEAREECAEAIEAAAAMVD